MSDQNSLDLDEIKKIYERQFKSKFDDNIKKKYMNDPVIVPPARDTITGFLRYKEINETDDNKYHKVIKEDFIFLSDLASIKKGSGAWLIEKLFNINNNYTVE